MLELNADNTAEYVRAKGWAADGPVHVELLTGGVSNVVLRVTTPRTRFIVKQSRPQLRTRDAWFSDINRIWREQEVMQALAKHVPPGVVPEMLHVDRENYAFAMSHAPDGARVWKEMLLGGEIDVAVAAQVGRFLREMHLQSSLHAESFAAFADKTIYEQLRIEPFYRRIQTRRPEVARAIEPIIEDMVTRREALCHGDYTPKNMLVHTNGFILVDYETAHLGDPTMDLGLLFAHLTLKCVRRIADVPRLVEVMDTIWREYAEPAPPVTDAETRGAAHLGAILLARIDGASPVEYLPEEEKRERIRRLGRAILLDGMRRWSDTWSSLRAL